MSRIPCSSSSSHPRRLSLALCLVCALSLSLSHTHTHTHTLSSSRDLPKLCAQCNSKKSHGLSGAVVCNEAVIDATSTWRSPRAVLVCAPCTIRVGAALCPRSARNPRELAATGCELVHSVASAPVRVLTHKFGLCVGATRCRRGHRRVGGGGFERDMHRADALRQHADDDRGCRGGPGWVPHRCSRRH